MIDSDVDVDDSVVVMIGIKEAANFADEIEEESKPLPGKRKMGKDEDAPTTDPEVNGTLTIVVHLCFWYEFHYWFIIP